MASVEILLPAQRYVFALDGDQAVPQSIDSSADGFRRYKELQAEGKTVGMLAFPNCLLVRGSEDYLVDPGVLMQGAPLLGAMQGLGVEAHKIKKVLMTHLHYDHAEALIAWPATQVYVHKLELEA